MLETRLKYIRIEGKLPRKRKKRLKKVISAMNAIGTVMGRHFKMQHDLYRDSKLPDLLISLADKPENEKYNWDI